MERATDEIRVQQWEQDVAAAKRDCADLEKRQSERQQSRCHRWKLDGREPGKRGCEVPGVAHNTTARTAHRPDCVGDNASGGQHRNWCHADNAGHQRRNGDRSSDHAASTKVRERGCRLCDDPDDGGVHPEQHELHLVTRAEVPVQLAEPEHDENGRSDEEECRCEHSGDAGASQAEQERKLSSSPARA